MAEFTIHKGYKDDRPPLIPKPDKPVDPMNQKSRAKPPAVQPPSTVITLPVM